MEGFVIPYGDSPLDQETVGELVYLDIINTARSYVHIMTPYLILNYELVQALQFAAKRGVETVSYTHLDVYKRQVRVWPSI